MNLKEIRIKNNLYFRLFNRKNKFNFDIFYDNIQELLSTNILKKIKQINKFY